MNMSMEQAMDEGEEDENFNSPKLSERNSIIQKDISSEDATREQLGQIEFYEDDQNKLKSKLLLGELKQWQSSIMMQPLSSLSVH